MDTHKEYEHQHFPHRETRYSVLAYDTCEIPDVQWVTIGQFRTAVEAIDCAERIIDESLLPRYKGGVTAEEMFSAFYSAGEMPCVFEKGNVTFNGRRYLHKRIRELTGEESWRPKSDSKRPW